MAEPFIPAAGVSPAGFFVPVVHVDPDEPIAMLADPIDFETGELLSIERGFDPVDAAVITALRIERGSGSAVEDVGQQYRKATHVDPALPALLREETRLALEHLVDAGDITFAVEPVTADDYADLQIRYQNVARQRENKLNLSPTQLLGGLV